MHSDMYYAYGIVLSVLFCIILADQVDDLLKDIARVETETLIAINETKHVKKELLEKQYLYFIKIGNLQVVNQNLTDEENGLIEKMYKLICTITGHDFYIETETKRVQELKRNIKKLKLMGTLWSQDLQTFIDGRKNGEEAEFSAFLRNNPFYEDTEDSGIQVRASGRGKERVTDILKSRLCRVEGELLKALAWLEFIKAYLKTQEELMKNEEMNCKELQDELVNYVDKVGTKSAKEVVRLFQDEAEKKNATDIALHKEYEKLTMIYREEAVKILEVRKLPGKFKKAKDYYEELMYEDISD